MGMQYHGLEMPKYIKKAKYKELCKLRLTKYYHHPYSRYRRFKKSSFNRYRAKKRLNSFMWRRFVDTALRFKRFAGKVTNPL